MQQRVKTNEAYFKRYGRTVYGTLVSSADSGIVVSVMVDRQDGNAIEEYTDNVVLMLLEDLDFEISN